MNEPDRLFIHDGSQPHSPHIATAFTNFRRGILTTTFRYTDHYIAEPTAWALGPDLPLEAQSVAHGLPGPLADAAPDRWGRALIAKQIRAQSNGVDGGHRTITDVDYLLGVGDTTRQGSLRFRTGTTETFQAANPSVPQLIDLPRLMQATQRVDSGGETEMNAIKELLAAGSASLGGARPKASVRAGNRLLLAKFPHNADSWDVMAWEATALDLAAASGIAVPNHRLLSIDGRSVLLLDRFDRRGHDRIPYISGMTLTGKSDGEPSDYIELAEAMSEHCDRIPANLHDLWTRIALSVTLNNTDDHLRNIGFLRHKSGWTLAPLFDVNPNPDTFQPRVTSIGWETTTANQLDRLLESAPYFGLTHAQCLTTLQQVQASTSKWREVARSNGITTTEMERFAPVFQEADR